MRPCRGVVAVVAVAAGCSLFAGCGVTQGVRYVYQDGDFGVVGIPQNTDHWPTFYRSQAEKLMGTHFPEGHEIVRAEEVIEGSRTLTTQGTKTAEIAPKLPAEILSLAKLGATASQSQADSLKIKECRIIYRRAPEHTIPDTFAKQSAETPATYIDPNALERRRARGEKVPDDPADKKPDPEKKPEAEKPEAAKPSGSAVG